MAERNYERELDELRAEVKTLTGQVKGKVSDALDDPRWQQFQDKARQEWDKMSVEAKDAAKRTDQYVKENPWKSAGFAAAAGFLAAMLLAPKRRD